MAQSAAKAPQAPKVEPIVFAADKPERRKIDDLKPYPRNPKTHSPEQVDAIAAMIREFGFTRPILVDEGDTILAGHGATMAARKLAYAELPVIVLRGLTDAQKRAIVIADNQASALGGWDKDLLKLELGELKRLDFNLALTGFNEADLVSYMVSTQPVPPGGFPAFGSDIPTEHECPKCHYKWSGASAPAPEGK